MPLVRVPSVLVLAVGNPLLGDDGVGLRALAALEEAGGLPDAVRLLDGGTAGLTLPEEVVLLGAEAGALAVSTELSPAVAAALPALVSVARAEALRMLKEVEGVVVEAQLAVAGGGERA